MPDVSQRAQDAGTSPTARRLVHVGWGAAAVVYATVAWLVLQMALGSASEEASSSGALQYVAQQPAGKIALFVLAVGLLAFAVGRVLEVTVLATEKIDAKDKAQGALMAVVYAALAFSAFSIAVSAGSGGSSGGGAEQKGSAVLLGLPGGRFLVAIVGLAVIGAGGYEIYKGSQKAFLDTLHCEQMPDWLRTATTPLGLFAYITKGLIFVLLGGFFVLSAIRYDPDKAEGLDGALRDVATAPAGRWILAFVALGMLSYALMCALESRYRKLGTSASGLG